jgi:hypothetical protein
MGALIASLRMASSGSSPNHELPSNVDRKTISRGSSLRGSGSLQDPAQSVRGIIALGSWRSRVHDHLNNDSAQGLTYKFL